jgi:uncharacterized membrane protein YccF (DUF307 family)
VSQRRNFISASDQASWFYYSADDVPFDNIQRKGDNTMPLIRLVLNILWFFLGGGIFIALGYLIGGIALCLTIIGIPLGLQTFKLARAGIAPFGLEIREIPRRNGSINFVLNIIWLIFGGIWIVLSHLVFGIGAALTIIGIPFALQHLKLAELGLTPFGKKLVSI